MTDKLIVSRSEIEALIKEQRYVIEHSDLYSDLVISIDDLRAAIIDKEEKSQAEAVATISISDNEPWGYAYKVELNDMTNSNHEWNTWVINTFGGIGQYSLYTSPPADKQDAERYRTIRKSGNNMRVVFGKYPDGINIHASENHLCGTALDEAIDEAMKGE